MRDLTAARAVASLGGGFRCVTLAGELLEPDGTLTVGTHHAEAGILSRKSELRDLRDAVRRLDAHLADLEAELADLRQRLLTLDAQASQADDAVQVLSEQANDMRWRAEQHRQRRQGLSEEVQLSQGEINALEADIERLEVAWGRALTQAETAEAAVTATQARQEAIEREAREGESLRERLQARLVTDRVALAQAEARLEALHRQAAALRSNADAAASEGRRFERSARRDALAGGRDRSRPLAFPGRPGSLVRPQRGGRARLDERVAAAARCCASSGPG